MMLQFLSKYCEAGVKTKPTQQISKVFILNPYISKNNILMVHIQSLWSTLLVMRLYTFTASILCGSLLYIYAKWAQSSLY